MGKKFEHVLTDFLDLKPYYSKNYIILVNILIDFSYKILFIPYFDTAFLKGGIRVSFSNFLDNLIIILGTKSVFGKRLQ